MLISDHIARLIESLIDDGGGSIELKRNDMAQQLGCSPSQINYVIASRFTPEKGYLIESRRGGGGYIRIIRKILPKNDYLTHLLRAIDRTLDERGYAALLHALQETGICSLREIHLLQALCSRTSLQALQDKELRDVLRAGMAQQLLLSLMD